MQTRAAFRRAEEETALVSHDWGDAQQSKRLPMLNKRHSAS